MTHCQSLPRLRRSLLQHRLKLKSLSLIYFVAHIRLGLLLHNSFASGYQLCVQGLKLLRLLTLPIILVIFLITILVVVYFKCRCWLIKHWIVLLLRGQFLDAEEFEAVVGILYYHWLMQSHVWLGCCKWIKIERVGIFVVRGIALDLVGPIIHIRRISCILIDASTECWLCYACSLLLVYAIIIVLGTLQVRDHLLVLSLPICVLTRSGIQLVQSEAAEWIVEDIVICLASRLGGLISSSGIHLRKLRNLIKDEVLWLRLLGLGVIGVKRRSVGDRKAIVERVVGHFTLRCPSSLALPILVTLSIIGIKDSSVRQTMTRLLFIIGITYCYLIIVYCKFGVGLLILFFLELIVIAKAQILLALICQHWMTYVIAIWFVALSILLVFATRCYWFGIISFLRGRFEKRIAVIFTAFRLGK